MKAFEPSSRARPRGSGRSSAGPRRRMRRRCRAPADASGPTMREVDPVRRGRSAAVPAGRRPRRRRSRTRGSSAVPGIARRDEHLRHARRLRDLPCERVLAAARTDDEYFHDQCLEMPHAREHHRDAVLVGGGDDLRVALRSARLDHGDDAVLGGGVEAVAEREERVRRHHRARGSRPSSRAFMRAMRARHDAAHLAGADADRHAVLREDDGVRLHVLADLPGESRSASSPASARAS